MKYCCTNCNYVYDESVWEAEENILPWTRIYELWDYFHCPVCYESLDYFEMIKEEINYIEDENTKDFLELEHFPVIKIEDSKLIVLAWKPKHTMWEKHYITSISLLDEYGDLIEEKFLKNDDKPIAKFDFDDYEDFEVVVRCSFHWLWWRKINLEKFLEN